MFGCCRGLCMQSEHSITGHFPVPFILSHASVCSLWGDASKGVRAECPPTQQRAAEWNMAEAIGKRNNEKERRRGGGATPLAWEWWRYDPVTYNASRVEVEGTDKCCKLTCRHTHTHRRSDSANVQTSSAGRTMPSTAVLETLGQIEQGTSEASTQKEHEAEQRQRDAWPHTTTLAFCCDLHSPC